MTKIKLCGITRLSDIDTINGCHPEYVGFVFAKNSRRYVSPEQAERLKERLEPGIKTVGVFVDEELHEVKNLLQRKIIHVAQLHGQEDEVYIKQLQEWGDYPVIKAFSINSHQDVKLAEKSSADLVLVDSPGGGTGTVFNWQLLKDLQRPYFLAGGLHPENVAEAIEILHPYGVDVSSGIETDGQKDREKMEAFVEIVRKR